MEQNKPENITLETPIKRGETEITSITLRKPGSGEMRGISLRGLLDFMVEDIIKVLPRISTPPLTVQEVASLDPADLLQMGGVIASFLLKKQALAQAQEAAGYPIQ